MEKERIGKSGNQAMAIRMSGFQKAFGIYDFFLLFINLCVFVTLRLRSGHALWLFEKTKPMLK
jgi:hypothetical protein